MLLDIHTHHPAPQPQAIISLYEASDLSLFPNQLYSIGIHPWYADKLQLERLALLAQLPQVVAIGECGIDVAKISETPMFRQMLLFRQQIELSECLKLPLIIHDVKGHAEILALRQQTNARQPWAIHGFRAKPSVAQMFLQHDDIYFSFGEKFNPDTLGIVPRNRILAETDESRLSIVQIIESLSKTLNVDMTDIIANNTARFLNI